MQGKTRIRSVYRTLFRHDRFYALFTVEGRDDEFLYYSHTTRPLRSIMYGRDFSGRIPQLLEKDDLCIECGLGLSIKGGVALDDGEIIAWNMSVDEANRLLACLKQVMGDAGPRIETF